MDTHLSINTTLRNIQKACELFTYKPGEYKWFMPGFEMDSNSFEIYFQFLRDLYDLGVPLNNMNAEGMYENSFSNPHSSPRLILYRTPLGNLVLQLYNGAFRYRKPLNSISLKMLGLGAELPLFAQVTALETLIYTVPIVSDFADLPDLAEGSLQVLFCASLRFG